MSGETNDTDPLEETVAGAVTGLTLLVAFGLLFAGVEFFWVAFPVGFGGVLPMSIGLTRYYQQQAKPAETATETADALESLRERYARGELSDEAFEQRVERLLETESVEDAQEYVTRGDTETDRILDRE
ncbi:Short C-terminal domain-containing protein [Halovenus aranensis]|jgi:uncharacterized membrane protein|uniref:Short C-terminal domain-containing protein n=1 Tax=Halovenus aranensis TaxID=890420 RepID=A0A1G8UBE3_9EURY|nr:SHOCT domain-containing protein [Halovenus aranensis]SDJ51072.1 Short C-terminal domain-containing protein [Halovenus aranensis]